MIRYIVYGALLLVLTILTLSGCSLIKKSSNGLITVKPQLADEIKLADRVTGIESMQNKLMDSFKAQVGELKTQLMTEFKMQAQVGMNNSVKENKVNAGGDVAQTTNDTGLMKYMVYVFGGLLMAAITGLVAIIKLFISNMNLSKNVKHKELEADEWKKSAILRIQNEQDFRSIENIIEGKKRGTK